MTNVDRTVGLTLLRRWAFLPVGGLSPGCIRMLSSHRERREAAREDVLHLWEISRAALEQIPHPTAPISKLAKLKCVGPATASAAVAAAAPEIYPFFDELVAEQIPGVGPVAWTVSYYARYAEALMAEAGKLGGEWTPARLERALWAHVGGKAGIAAA